MIKVNEGCVSIEGEKSIIFAELAILLEQLRECGFEDDEIEDAVRLSKMSGGDIKGEIIEKLKNIIECLEKHGGEE